MLSGSSHVQKVIHLAVQFSSDLPDLNMELSLQAASLVPRLSFLINCAGTPLLRLVGEPGNEAIQAANPVDSNLKMESWIGAITETTS